MKVAVLMGGRSPEREVSLRSGHNASQALKDAGFDVVEIDAQADIAQKIFENKADVVFIALHGELGEDGTLQGLLEYIGVPYTGSGVMASAVAMDKCMSKKLFSAAGVPTPGYIEICRETDNDDIREMLEDKKLEPPIVIKPNSLGSTIGISILYDFDGLEAAVKEAFNYSHKVLIEEFVPGKEITVGILGGKEPFAVPSIEIVPKGEYYTYETKYLPGMSDHIIPARIGEEANILAEELALKAHNALECYGMSRVDMIVREDGKIFVLEVNTIPGMTQTSLLPEAAAKIGIDFREFVKLQVEWALEREKEKPLISRKGPGILTDEVAAITTNKEKQADT